MKKLVLIRHGKSSWKYNVKDHERPLKQRGEEDSKLVSEAFLEHQILPNKIFSSSAKRALNTCKIFAKSLQIPENEIEIVDDLYDFGGQNVINFIKSIDDKYKSIMIFGHNHAFTSISNIFGDKFIDNLPTSGLVVINFKVDLWQDINQGKTQMIIFPKELKKHKD